MNDEYDEKVERVQRAVLKELETSVGRMKARRAVVKFMRAFDNVARYDLLDWLAIAAIDASERTVVSEGEE